MPYDVPLKTMGRNDVLCRVCWSGWIPTKGKRRLCPVCFDSDKAIRRAIKKGPAQTMPANNVASYRVTRCMYCRLRFVDHFTGPVCPDCAADNAFLVAKGIAVV